MQQRASRWPFVLFWLAHTAGLFGDVLFNAGMMWFVYQRTGSALATTGVPLADVLARVLVGMVAGSLADRRARARWMAQLQALKAVLVAFALLGLQQGWLQPWMTYALTLGFSSLNALYEPVYPALLPGLVPEAWLTQANAVVHISRTLAFGLSWLLGGYLLTRLAPQHVAALNLAALALAVAGYLWLHGVLGERRPVAQARLGPGRVLQDLRTGAAWLWRHPWLRSLLWISLPGWLTLGLWGPLQLVFLDRIFQAGASAWGVMQAAFFLSGLVGALLASAWQGRLPWREGQWAAGVALFHGLLTVLYGLAPNLGVVLSSVVLAGVTDPFFLAARDAVLQAVTPDALRGRVLAVWNILAALSMAASYLLLGALAERVPLRVLYTASGVLITLVYAGLTFFTPLTQARVGSKEAPSTGGGI